MADSSRWHGFPHRAGDIVISTPSKSGTTWMQQLCALLVFDGPELPEPLPDVSPWVDSLLEPLDELLARVEAQSHRRILKTHAPLDALDLHPEVTYLVVGRDPRDVWVSMTHHGENMATEELVRRRTAVAGPYEPSEPEPDLPDDPDEAFAFQLTLAPRANSTTVHTPHVLHHLADAWARRHEPNVHLFHYADLRTDLVGQLRRLADVLGIPLPAGRASELAAEATLDAMRARAAATAPEATRGAWKDPARFFRTGGVGEWRAWMSSGTERVYHETVARHLADPALIAWVHDGWGTAG